MKINLQLFLLLLLIVSTISAQKYRIKQTYKLPFIPNKINALPNEAVALTQDGIIQIITGQNLSQTIQRFDINSNPNSLLTINDSIFYLDSGVIYSAISTPNSQVKQVQYNFPSTSAQSLFQMKQIDNTQIIPSTGGSFIIQMDLINFNISLNYNTNISSSSISNIVALSNGFYYYARLQGTEIVVYRIISKSSFVSKIFSISTSIINPAKSVQSLQIIQGINQKTFILAWNDPSFINPSIIYIYTLDTNNSIIKSRNYSCFYTQSKATSASQMILLGYNEVHSLNLNSLTQIAQQISLTNTLFFDSFSADGIYALNIDSRVIVDKYYTQAYLYKYNSTISNYSLLSDMITNVAGSATRGSTFLGNSNYLILQQKPQNTSSTNPQISVFNIDTLSYAQNLIQSNPNITNYIHYCSPLSSSSLLIISNSTNIFELHHYNIVNDTSYNHLGSIQIPYTPTASLRNISCVGNNQLVFIEKLNSSDWSYQLLQINPDGTLFSKISLIQTIKSIGIYSIAAFFIDCFLIKDQINQDLSYLYDYNFNKIDIPLDSSIKDMDIIDHSQTSMVLYNPLEKTYQYYLYSSNSFTYQGSYSSIDNRNNRVRSMILIQSLKKLYVTYTINATIFDLNVPHLQKIGVVKDPYTLSSIKLDRARFSTQNGGLKLFGSNKNSIYRFDISNTSNSVTYEESISLDITPMSVRLSSDQSKIIVAKVSPKSILDPIYIVEVYESLSLTSQIFMTTLTDIQINEAIIDSDYTSTQTLILAGKQSQNQSKLYIHLYSNNQKTIRTSSQISEITTFTIGKNWISYSGVISSTQQISNFVYYHLFDNIGNISKIDVGCTVGYLQFNTIEEQILGYCQNGSFFIFSRINQSLKKGNGSVVTEAKFLNNTFILINQGGVIAIIDIRTLQQINYNSLNLGATSTVIAIDQTKQIIASADLSVITIYDFNKNLIDTFTLPQGENVVSLSFNTNDDLYISTNSQTLYLWTSTSCSDNQTLSGPYCKCKKTFLNQSGACICPNNLVIISGLCDCSTGYYEANTYCQECSSFCKSCTDNVCDEYSVLFFILVIGAPLILFVLGVVVFIKIRKAKKAQISQVSTENMGAEEKVGGSETKRSGKNRLLE